jgi:Protein of unknown function DUF72
MIADILGERMGCFLFQLPPSYRYTKARLNAIVSQLDPARRNAVEFRHASWWNEEVFTAPSVRQALSSALAAGHGFLMSLLGRRTKYTCGCTAPSAGIGMTIQRTSSWNGRTGLKQVGRREPGSTSIMITMPMRQRTRLLCGAC